MQAHVWQACALCVSLVGSTSCHDLDGWRAQAFQDLAAELPWFLACAQQTWCNVCWPGGLSHSSRAGAAGTVQAFQDLAEELPWSKHVHSKLVCALTREVMNEHNPPMVLPNGAVYSQKAIQQLANAEGVFTCPVTGALVASPIITLII